MIAESQKTRPRALRIGSHRVSLGRRNLLHSPTTAQTFRGIGARALADFCNRFHAGSERHAPSAVSRRKEPIAMDTAQNNVAAESVRADAGRKGGAA
jgi:hypothetical protein